VLYKRCIIIIITILLLLLFMEALDSKGIIITLKSIMSATECNNIANFTFAT